MTITISQVEYEASSLAVSELVDGYRYTGSLRMYLCHLVEGRHERIPGWAERALTDSDSPGHLRLAETESIEQPRGPAGEQSDPAAALDAYHAWIIDRVVAARAAWIGRSYTSGLQGGTP